MNLYADWVESGPKALRAYLIKEKNLREIMIFALTQRNNDEKHEVIGLVSIDHDQFFGYSQHWRHTIGLVNDQIMIALEQTGLINVEDQALRRSFHEIKEETLYFTNRIGNYMDRTVYFRKRLKEIVNMQDLLEIKSEIKQLSETPMLMNTALKECRSAYSNLNKKLDRVSRARLYTFLNIDPNWLDQAQEIDMKNCHQNCLNGYRNRLKKRGIHWNLNINPINLTWLVPEELLRRVLQNLLDNVAKYTLSNSIVEIKVRPYYICISNLSCYDPNLKSQWPFRAGLRGIAAREFNAPGEGNGMTIVALYCNKILRWSCEFEQKPVTVAGKRRANFSITIRRQQ